MQGGWSRGQPVCLLVRNSSVNESQISWAYYPKSVKDQ